MKRHLLILLVLSAVATIPCWTSVLESASGQRIQPAEFSASTRIDGRIAVTDVVETFNLAELAPGVDPGVLTLRSNMGNGATVFSVWVDIRGEWHQTQVVPSTTTWAECMKAPPGITHLSTPRTDLAVFINVMSDERGVIRSKISYTQVLLQQGAQLRYHLPAVERLDGTEILPRAWTVAIASPVPLASVHTTHGDRALFAASMKNAILRKTWGPNDTIRLVPTTLYIDLNETPGTTTNTITGWHGTDEYAIHLGTQDQTAVAGPRQTRKIWVVLDDHLTGRQSYGLFKRLYQETIDLLRPDDDYNVYQITRDLFKGWRQWSAANPDSPLDALSWAMQSMGYADNSTPIQPAEWILKMPEEVTNGVDVIYLTHAVRSHLHVYVSPGQAAELRKRGVRLFTIAESSFPDDLSSLAMAAKVTGATFTIEDRFQDPKAVCTAVLNTIRQHESRVLDVASASPTLRDAVQWSLDGSRSIDATVTAMRIIDRAPGSLVIDGFRQGSRHTWNVDVYPALAAGTSTMVPRLWAQAFCMAMERIRAELSESPATQAEISAEIRRTGEEFQIATSETTFSLNLRKRIRHIPSERIN